MLRTPTSSSKHWCRRRYRSHHKCECNHNISGRYARCCHWPWIDCRDDSECHCKQLQGKRCGKKSRKRKYPKASSTPSLQHKQQLRAQTPKKGLGISASSTPLLSLGFTIASLLNLLSLGFSQLAQLIKLRLYYSQLAQLLRLYYSQLAQLVKFRLLPACSTRQA